MTGRTPEPAGRSRPDARDTGPGTSAARPDIRATNPDTRVTILRGGLVLDPREGRIERADLVLRGATIAGRGRFYAEVPDAALLIDVHGSWLMPGLVDAHAHIAGAGGEAADAAQCRARVDAYLAAGVTTIRDAGSPDCTALTMAADVDAPLIRAAGSQIRSSPDTAAAASTAMTLAAAGAAWLKAYALGPLELASVLRVARSAGLSVGAHLGDDPAAGIELGVPAIEHVYPLIRHDLVSSDERASPWIPAADATIATWLLADPERPAIDAWYREVGRTRPFLVPTLHVMRGLRGRAGGRPVAASEAPWSTAAERSRWGAQLRGWGWWDLRPGSSPELRERALRNLGLTARRLADAGCRVCVGSDFDSPFIPPGAGVSAEMRDLEAAGFGRLEVVRAATSEAADLLGLRDRIGSFAVGARADILVLSANPLDSLDALAVPRLVIAAGRVAAGRVAGGSVAGGSVAVSPRSPS